MTLLEAETLAAAIASGWQARLWDGSAPLADVLAPEG